MTLVVSVGGSVLVPNLEEERIQAYGETLANLGEEFSVAAVVGGGGVARDYIETARDLGGNEAQLDSLGIDVTRLNARLLIIALGEQAALTPAKEIEEAAAVLRNEEIAVMGGTVPGHTTDAVSALLAEFIDANLLAYATSVPGVFDKDPDEHDDSERFDRLTTSELLELVAGGGSLGSAGSKAPIDLLAATIIDRAGMHAVVFDGTDPASVPRAVDWATTQKTGTADSTFEGTEIVPER